MVKDVTVFDLMEEHLGASADQGKERDLYAYLTELLEDAPQVMLDYLTEDLGRYEQTGHASRTISRLLDRARCLAEADRISLRFAA
jgi:hypothetical protein